MSRRHRSPFKGSRYIGNTNTNEVHDLDNEKAVCQIDEIMSEHVRTFSPDTHAEAKRKGFDNCAYCIGDSDY